MARVRRLTGAQGRIAAAAHPLRTGAEIAVAITNVTRQGTPPTRVTRYGSGLKLVTGPGPTIWRTDFALAFASIADANAVFDLAGQIVAVRSGEADWAYGMLTVHGRRPGGFVGQWRTMRVSVTELISE